MKLCKDCEHFRSGSYIYPSRCQRPLTTALEPVYGTIADRLSEPCRAERAQESRGLFRRRVLCGPNAIFFEKSTLQPKQTKPGARPPRNGK